MAFACALPGAYVLSTDLIRRGSQILGFDSTHQLAYLASVVASTLGWGALALAIMAERGAMRRLFAAAFGVFFVSSAAVQGAFFSLFKVYYSVDSSIDSRSLLRALDAELPLRSPGELFQIGGAAIATGSLLAFFLRMTPAHPPPRRMTIGSGCLALLVFFQAPASYRTFQSTTPDLIYFNAVSGLIGLRLRVSLAGEPARPIRVARRSPDQLPRLPSSPPLRRNVLLVLEESQRADETCIEFDPDCKKATPFSNAAAPGRIPLLQMRAVGSSTAVAIMSIFSGLPPTASGAEIERAPLLWDFAHAAGFDTAYWTSQHLMFGNARLYLEDIPVSHWVSGTELEPQSDLLAGARDELLTDRVLAEIGELQQPYFAVVHYSNIHKPRIYDPKQAPFQPSDDRERPSGEIGQQNFYRNSVYLSDRAVGRLLGHLRETTAGERTVVLYLADHGESYFEHGQNNNHSGSVYDEEIRIPAWIDAPAGTLSEEEKRHLEAFRDLPVFETDVAPTVLQLLGIDPTAGRVQLQGRSLLCADTRPVVAALSNTSWAWEYVSPNWGVIGGNRKLEARASDDHYHCFDLAKDPGERTDLGESGCADLVLEADRIFHRLPKDIDRLNRHPEWGSGP